MNLEIWKILAQFAMPIVVLFVGFRINSNLEQDKAAIGIHKEWRFKWAELFFSTSVKFNENAQNFITASFHLASFRDVGLLTENLSTRFNKERLDSFLELQKAEYSLKILSDLAPHTKTKLLESSTAVTTFIGNFLKTDSANIDEITSLLSVFNALAKRSHNEILTGIKEIH